MITKEELNELKENYFEVLQAEAFAITLKPKTQAIIGTYLKGNIPHSGIS